MLALAKISCTIRSENTEQIKAFLAAEGVSEIREGSGMHPGTTQITCYVLMERDELDAFSARLGSQAGVSSVGWQQINVNQILS